uniref:Uncharacterized protein n=1 Tax=Cacopsylla melanoneura TaxID=428564 RepID=A0A8D8ZZL1_9HEMI
MIVVRKRGGQVRRLKESGGGLRCGKLLIVIVCHRGNLLHRGNSTLCGHCHQSLLYMEVPGLWCGGLYGLGTLGGGAGWWLGQLLLLLLLLLLRQWLTPLCRRLLNWFIISKH